MLTEVQKRYHQVLCIFPLLPLYKKPTLCLKFLHVLMNCFHLRWHTHLQKPIVIPIRGLKRALICNESKLTFIIMHYTNSHSCLAPISEIKVLLTAILVWLIRIYPWTALEVFCKQEKINNTVLKKLIDMSTLLNVRTPSL